MISETLRNLIYQRELVLGVVLSQVISNVPAAILLSGFTKEVTPLLYGVNVGGLGTLIASLASVISYGFYSKVEGA
ncbi:MAG: citrate transporter, partial [Lachnospiraceae bacterium]|nr:citrate transporter [Lachnospiraceae bacterium]